jgi:hypothetical protein
MRFYTNDLFLSNCCGSKRLAFAEHCHIYTTQIPSSNLGCSAGAIQQGRQRLTDVPKVTCIQSSASRRSLLERFDVVVSPLTVPSASLTSSVANSQESDGKLMLKLMRNRSPCALLSTTSSSLVSTAKKLLNSCIVTSQLVEE